MEEILWWGYQHISGTLRVKRYFNNEDIVEARRSPFVKQIAYPFHADNNDEAWKYINEFFK